MRVGQAPFDAMAQLPRGLWLPALITHAPAAATKIADVQRWLDSLLGGELPPADADFGVADVAAALRDACQQLGLAGLARETPAMAEQLLRTLLWHLDRLIDLQPRLTREQAVAEIAEQFRASWQQEKGDWDEVLSLLQALGPLAQLSRDQLQGLLSSREWTEAQRIAQHLEKMPELMALIRRLGRSQRQPRAAARAAPERPGLQRLPLRAVETRLPGLPGELRGIRHVARFDQQLPSEAAMLMHPVLAKLWRARHAEGRLLGYDSEALLVDWRVDHHAPPLPAVSEPEPQALERGPFIVCLDTSGSMRGAPENIAKAVVLEAMRTAHRERRGCRLIAFGGPGEVIEQELGFDPAGLQALLALMGRSFDGGTDVQAPIERAVAVVHEVQWQGADLLVVSDGEFGCVPGTLDKLDRAREAFGLRVQGVLIGDRETMGLMEVADEIFWLRDWRRHADSPETAAERSGFSPVHSKSLTALYFPNALSSRAARHRPASDGA